MFKQLMTIPRCFDPAPPRPVRVSRPDRDTMVRLIRDLAARRITNVEFDGQAASLASRTADDPALLEAYLFCWSWYDDLRTHRLHRLSREQRRLFARVVLFLRSDEPYCWIERRAHGRPFGPLSTFADALVFWTFGLALPVFAAIRFLLWMYDRRSPRHVAPRPTVHADHEAAWPFPDVASFAAARARLHLLGARDLLTARRISPTFTY